MKGFENWQLLLIIVVVVICLAVFVGMRDQIFQAATGLWTGIVDALNKMVSGTPVGG